MGSALEIMIRVSSGAGFHGNGKQSYLDPTLCKILGYIPEDLPGARPPFIYRPPEERDAVLEAFAKTASREAPAGGFELRFRPRNGKRFDAIVLILPLVDGAGPCTPGWRVSDITNHKNGAGSGPPSLDLEVTESVIMGKVVESARLLKELKKLGVSVSPNDFGTGYFTLSYLHQLPIDNLKIDRSFVQRMNGAASTWTLVQAIVAFAP